MDENNIKYLVMLDFNGGWDCDMFVCDRIRKAGSRITSIYKITKMVEQEITDVRAAEKIEDDEAVRKTEFAEYLRLKKKYE